MATFTMIDQKGKETTMEADISFSGSFGMWGKPLPTILDFKPTRVTFNGLTTIVFWSDDTKTIVRCSNEDVYDRERAVASAVAHRMFGSKNQFKKFVSNGYEAMTVQEELERQREKALKKLES